MGETTQEKRFWGRRVTAVAIWVVLVTTAFYIAMFRGLPLDWWVEYAKYNTYALGFLVGGVTITDSIFQAGVKK